MKLEVSKKHLDDTPGLKDHINATIGQLDRFVPARRQEHLHATVHIDQKSDKSQIIAKATLHMKGIDIAATEKGDNVFVVVDVLENKLKKQLKKQRSQHRRHRFDRKGVMAKIARKTNVN